MKQGPSTLVVSLPSKWAKKHNLKKGDTIHLEEKGKSLTLALKPQPSEKKITLNVSNTLPMTHRIAGALYKAGFDEMTLIYTHGEEAKAILEAVQVMTGHEIIKHEKNSIVIKRLVHADGESFSTVYRKCFHVLADMAQETVEAFKNNDIELMGSVVIKDRTMAIFADYCRRIVLAADAPEQSQQLYHLIEQIEKIADRFKEMCAFYAQKKYKPSKEVIGLLQDIATYVHHFQNLCHDFSLEKVSTFGRERENISKKLNQNIKSTTKQDFIALHRCNSILSSIFDLNGALLTMKLPQVSKP